MRKHEKVFNYGPTTTRVTVEMPDSLSYGAKTNSVRIVVNCKEEGRSFRLGGTVSVEKGEEGFQPFYFSENVKSGAAGTDTVRVFTFQLGDNLWGELKDTKKAYVSIGFALMMYDQTWDLGTESYTVTAGDDMKPTFDLSVELSNRVVFQGITPVTAKILNESLKYSATEASAKVTIGNKTFNGKTATVTPDAVGSLPISATVIDSRGFSVTKSASVYVNMYIAPRLEDVLVTRVDGSGSQSFEGTSAAVVVTFESGNNPNAATTCSLAYRENGATQFTPFGTAESGKRVTIGNLLASKTYEIRATVTDGITTESKSVFLSGNTVTMDFLADGKGVAFGCEATKEGFECAMPATFTPPIPNDSLDAAPRDHTHDYAATGHKHSAGDITSGTLPVARGGTGQTSLQALRNAMGLGNTTGALPVANGGTGANNTASARTNLGISNAVTAEGNSGIWHWRKYSNGYAEAWGVTSYTPSGMSNDNWRWLSSTAQKEYALPFTFKVVYSAQATFNASYIWPVLVTKNAAGSDTRTNATKLGTWGISAAATTSACELFFYVCGTY